MRSGSLVRLNISGRPSYNDGKYLMIGYYEKLYPIVQVRGEEVIVSEREVSQIGGSS